MFAGNTADPSTVGVQVKKVQQRFGLESIALVGDRGMLTTARLRDDLEPAGLAWISALKTDAIRKLLRKPQPDAEGAGQAPLRRRLAPLLFEEEDRAGARALRQSPVEKAQVSASTKAKAASKQTPEGLPVHSFQTLLADLGTLTLNQVTLPDAPQHPFPMVAKPTPLQAKAFDLLGVDPGKFVASKLAG